MASEEEDNSTSICLNINVVPPSTEGQDELRQSASAFPQGAEGNSPAAGNASAEDLFPLGGNGAFDPFLDDFFTPFNIGAGDGNAPLGLRSTPSATEQDGSGWYRWHR
jgi:hypothetical protein